MDISIIYDKDSKRVAEACHFSNNQIVVMTAESKMFETNEDYFFKWMKEKEYTRKMPLLQTTSDLHLLGMKSSPSLLNYYQVWTAMWKSIRQIKHELLDEIARKVIGD